MSKKVLHTKFGTAHIRNGYYIVYGGEHNNQKLHRLIFEDFHKCTILPGNAIHHKDHNKLNNDISNLELISMGNHTAIHNELRRIDFSKNKSSTGIYRVGKQKHNDMRQGFTWRYRCYVCGRRIQIRNIDLRKLKEEIISRGLEWNIVDEEKAKQSFKENEENMRQYYE